MGAVAALRRTDGRIRWLRTYERSVPLSSNGRHVMYSLRTEGAWFDNPILLTPREVIVAPRDATRLLSIARDSGTLLRLVETPGVPRKPYLLGIRQGMLYRAGPAGIDAYNVGNGSFALTRLYAAKAPVIMGRPALTDEGIYCCMSGGLCFYQFDSNTMLRVASWPEEDDDRYAGDVTVAGDLVMVVSELRVTAFVSAERRAP
jgi:hypothetical protein